MRRWAGPLSIATAVAAVLWLGHDTLFGGLFSEPVERGAPQAQGEEDAAQGAREGSSGAPTLEGLARPRPAAEELSPEELARRAALAAAERAALEGRVGFGGTLLDAAGRPVAGAQVVVAGDLGGSHVARTDADGAFALQLRPGRYDVLITSPGRGTLHLEDYVVDGAARLDLELELAAPSRVTLLVERAGAGVPEAQVSARLTRWRWEGELPIYAGATDRDGRVIFPDLVAGTYALEARIPQGPLLRQTLEVKRDVDVKLVVPDAVEFFGRVTDAATGSPVAGAEVVIVTSNKKGPSLECSAVSADDGVYRVRIPMGSPVSLSVRATGYAPWPHPREAAAVLKSLKGLASPQAPVERNVALTPGAALLGIVTEQGTGTPLSGIALSFRQRLGAAVSATSGEEGRYAVSHLNAGDHDVQVETAGWYPERPLRVRVGPRGDEPVPFDVTLLGARSLAGRVLLSSGAPVGGARVWLTGGGRIVRSARGSGRPLETFSSTDGRFTLSDVPPNLDVLVRAAVGALEGTPVAVAAGRPAPDPLHLVLAETGGVSGRVVELGSGEPLANARVTLRPQGEPPGRDGRTALSDAQGRFAFAGLIPGDYELRAQRSDHLPLPARTLAVGDGAEQRVELALDPGFVLAGLVLDPQGRAIPGGSVRVDGVSNAGGPAVRRSGAVGADGRFRLTGFARGVYRLRVEAPGHRGRVLEGLEGGEERLRVELPVTPAPGS